MEKGELSELCLQLYQKLEEALKNREDKELLTKMAQGLAREFVPIHKNLWSTAEDLFHFIDKLFRRSQANAAKAIEDYLEQEKYEKALEILSKKTQEHMFLHDLYLEILTVLESTIAEVFGEDSLYDALRYAGEKKKNWFEETTKLPVDDLVRHTAWILKMHNGNLKIEEDDEKFTFIMNPCGSGGRLWRGETQGVCLKRHYMTIKPHIMNLGQEGLPAYCTHCPVWNSLLPFEWFGNPLWVYDLPTKPEDPCKAYIYKNSEDIPKEYLNLLKEKK